MGGDALEELRARWQASGGEYDLVAYLRAWSRDDPHRLAALALAARFGHAPARAALDDPPPDFVAAEEHDVVPGGPGVELAALEALFGRWEPAFVYLRAVLRTARRWWFGQGPAYATSLARLEPLRQTLDAWFAAPDPAQAQDLQAWSSAGASLGELVSGDHEAPADRALTHLISAWAILAAVAAPRTAPARTPPPSVDALRLGVVHDAVFEVHQTVKGIDYARHVAAGGRLTAPYGGGPFPNSRGPLVRAAASELSAWLLRDL